MKTTLPQCHCTATATATAIQPVGMGPRYVISVTKNEVKNEFGCYQNRIDSHFNSWASTTSCNLVNLKIT